VKVVGEVDPLLTVGGPLIVGMRDIPGPGGVAGEAADRVRGRVTAGIRVAPSIKIQCGGG